jgi:hypothetical protein
MNVHVPQAEEACTEALMLMGVAITNSIYRSINIQFIFCGVH